MLERALVKAILADNEALACHLIRSGAKPCDAVVHKKVVVFPILAACYMGHEVVVRLSVPLSELVVSRAIVCAAASPYGSEVAAFLVAQPNVQVTAEVLQWAARRRNPRAVKVLVRHAAPRELVKAIGNVISVDRVRAAAVMLSVWEENDHYPRPRIFMVRSRKAWGLLARHGLQPFHSTHCQIPAIVGKPPYVCCAYLGDVQGMVRELRRPGVDAVQLRIGLRLAATNVIAIARLALRGFSAATVRLWPPSSVCKIRTLVLCLYRRGCDAVVVRRVLLFVARE